MKVAGFQFRVFSSESRYSGPGVLIYTHATTGKQFVRTFANCAHQRSRNNFPTPLKELLRKVPGDVHVYLSELQTGTRDALYVVSRAVISALTEKGTLYRRERNSRGIYRPLPGEENIKYTVWSMTDRATGAVFYFPERVGIQVTGKVNQRIMTFNGYVLKNVVNANRVMHHFAKKYHPLSPEQFILRDLGLEVEGEEAAFAEITKLSCNDIKQGICVLSKVSSTDALYYRNNMLRLKHVGVDQYIP